MAVNKVSSYGVFSGVLFFLLIPSVLDGLVPYHQNIFGTHLFLILFAVFINVHHYFIDSAIWRKGNPDMKYLYR